MGCAVAAPCGCRVMGVSHAHRPVPREQPRRSPVEPRLPHDRRTPRVTPPGVRIRCSSNTSRGLWTHVARPICSACSSSWLNVAIRSPANCIRPFSRTNRIRLRGVAVTSPHEPARPVFIVRSMRTYTMASVRHRASAIRDTSAIGAPRPATASVQPAARTAHTDMRPPPRCPVRGLARSTRGASRPSDACDPPAGEAV